MRQFLVLQEIWVGSPEDGPSCDEPGYEPVADFDTREEAEAYIATQTHPHDFHVEDQDEEDVLSDFDGDVLDLYSDDDDDFYDDDEDDVSDEEDRLHDDEDDMC